MNIKEAKQEIIHTVQAYLKKDDAGLYAIPTEKQRPILLMGSPGVGKTAIMEQIALELGINLISYTITHHTRQSAIGLPYIEKKMFGGKEYSVTEYTMSEIIASVYERIEETGIKEGILFLDEINCVSETLAPTMLQFLQYKTFGSHQLPDGFIVVTAGNPPQYNKSVRDFDIVTLDRVKKIPVEEDYSVWKEYAQKAGVHGSIQAYLEIKKQNFYKIRTDVEERYFVTARGWEDLSNLIHVYEADGIPIDEKVVRQYLQEPEIARDFASYYALYQKYRETYRVPEILGGYIPEDTLTIRNAPFDEKLSLICLLTDSLHGEFSKYVLDLAVQKELFGHLSAVKEMLESGEENGQLSMDKKNGRKDADCQEPDVQDGDAEADMDAAGRQDAFDLVETRLQNAERSLQRLRQTKQISRAEERIKSLTLKALSECLNLRESYLNDTESFDRIREWFSVREQKRQEAICMTGLHLTNCFTFLSRVFGEEQEMVMFLSELAADVDGMQFVSECGNEAFDRYNRLLLLKNRRQELTQEILSLT